MSTLYFVNDNNKAELILRNDTAFLEREIEDFIQNNGEILLGEKLLFIGRQVITETNKRIDLLAIDSAGRLIVIELKRGIAPRDMMAQILDYSSWLNKLSEREIEKIARDFFDKYKQPYKSLLHAYETYFEKPLMTTIGGEILNVLFAEDFPTDLVNAAEYLFNNGVSIYCIKFEHYRDPKNGIYILLNVIVGDELVTTIDGKTDCSPISGDAVGTSKGQLRRILSNIAQKLEENNKDWMDSFSIKRKPFKRYQRADGSWNTVFCEWNIAWKRNIYINFSIKHLRSDFSFEDEVKFENCSVRLVIPQKDFSQKYNEINELMEKHNYRCLDSSTINPIWKNDYFFNKVLIDEEGSKYINFDEGAFLKLAECEMEDLRPIITKLLDGSFSQDLVD